MSERCRKHTKYESFVKHLLKINRKEENVLNLYVLFSFIYLHCYYCYFSYYCYEYYHIVIIILVIIILTTIIRFYAVTICFIFDGARLWRELEVSQISGDVKNKRNGGNHEVDENDDNTFIYIYIIVYLFLLLLFIYYFF